MVSRHKPTREQRAATHPATDADYTILAQHVVSAVIAKCRDIVIRFPYFVALPDDWPRGILVKRDESYNYYRVKVFKAADWMFKHGYLQQDAKGLVKSMRSVVNLLGEADRLLTTPEQEFLKGSKISVDTEENVEYNSTSETKEE
jgi:hypothetical protein